MQAGRYDIVIEQGTTWTKDFILNTTSGDPVDLTNFSAKLEVRRHAYSPNVIFTMSTVLGTIILNASTGTITLSLDAADTSALTNFLTQPERYDLEIADDHGNVYRVLEGWISVSEDVTKS